MILYDQEMTGNNVYNASNDSATSPNMNERLLEDASVSSRAQEDEQFRSQEFATAQNEVTRSWILDQTVKEAQESKIFPNQEEDREGVHSKLSVTKEKTALVAENEVLKKRIQLLEKGLCREQNELRHPHQTEEYRRSKVSRADEPACEPKNCDSNTPTCRDQDYYTSLIVDPESSFEEMLNDMKFQVHRLKQINRELEELNGEKENISDHVETIEEKEAKLTSFAEYFETPDGNRLSLVQEDEKLEEETRNLRDMMNECGLIE
jgi:hypothetical protein